MNARYWSTTLWLKHYKWSSGNGAVVKALVSAFHSFKVNQMGIKNSLGPSGKK